MSDAFLRQQISAIEAQITAWQAAATALGAGQIASYSLDTGQSKQNVTNANIQVLNDAIDGLYNRLETLEIRLNGGGTVTVTPGW